MTKDMKAEPIRNWKQLIQQRVLPCLLLLLLLSPATAQSEKLYDLEKDVAEWKNLAGNPRLKTIQTKLARAVPRTVAAPPTSGAKK